MSSKTSGSTDTSSSLSKTSYPSTSSSKTKEESSTSSGSTSTSYPSGTSTSKSSKTTKSSKSSRSSGSQSRDSSRSSKSSRSSRTRNSSSTGKSDSTKTRSNSTSVVTSYPSYVTGSHATGAVCLVERDIWIVEGLVTTLFACLIAGFFIKNFVEWAGLIAAKRGIVLDDGLSHRLLMVIFLGQTVFIPLQATKYMYAYIRDDQKYMTTKKRLITELLLFSSIMVVVQTLSFDFMILHLLITCCYLAPTIVTLVYLFWFYKVIVPPDAKLVVHALCTVFATFLFKEFFLERQFCDCRLF